MESRKTVQMNLFAGQEQRCRCREWTGAGQGGRRGGGRMNWETGVDIDTPSLVNR